MFTNTQTQLTTAATLNVSFDTIHECAAALVWSNDPQEAATEAQRLADITSGVYVVTNALGDQKVLKKGKRYGAVLTILG